MTWSMSTMSPAPSTPGCGPTRSSPSAACPSRSSTARRPAAWWTVRGGAADAVGLRSLAPDDPGYVGHYRGDARARDEAYHQGTVWPWLIGVFVDAWLARARTQRGGEGRGAAALSPALCRASRGGGARPCLRGRGWRPARRPRRLPLPALVARRIPTPARNARYRGQLRRRTRCRTTGALELLPRRVAARRGQPAARGHEMRGAGAVAPGRGRAGGATRHRRSGRAGGAAPSACRAPCSRGRGPWSPARALKRSVPAWCAVPPIGMSLPR